MRISGWGAYAGVITVPYMHVTAQNHLRRQVVHPGNTVKFGTNTIAQNVSTRIDKGPVDYVDGFLDLMNRGSK